MADDDKKPPETNTPFQTLVQKGYEMTGIPEAKKIGKYLSDAVTNYGKLRKPVGGDDKNKDDK